MNGGRVLDVGVRFQAPLAARAASGCNSMTRAQLLRLGIVALVVVQCLVWVVAVSIVWSFRDLMVGTGSHEAADNARFAIAIFAGAAINGIALVPFLLQQRGWGWVLLIAVQIADVVVTVAEALLISEWWWLITVLAGLTIGFLYLFRRAAVATA